MAMVRLNFKIAFASLMLYMSVGCDSISSNSIESPKNTIVAGKKQGASEHAVVAIVPHPEIVPPIPINFVPPLPTVWPEFHATFGAFKAPDQKPCPCEDGLNCWYLNANGACDLASEDINNDSLCTALDCQGPEGPMGLQGIQGIQGMQGIQGVPGEPGTTCAQPFVASQIVYVNKAGDDVTGDGSLCAPFLTINQAMLSITDATTTKRYEINIGPGRYTEAPIHLKANVQLVGATNMLTVINSDVDINDPSWAVLESNNLFTDHRSGFFNLSLFQQMNFNFDQIESWGGKLFFVNVNTNSTFVPTFTAQSTSVNQVNIRSSELVNGYTQNGINMMLFGSWVSGGNITINTQAHTDTQVNLIGGGINIKTGQPGAGNIIVTSNNGDIPFSIFNLISFGLGGNNLGAGGELIVVNNAQPLTIAATVDSIPIRTKVSISGSGTTTLRRYDVSTTHLV